MGLRSTSAEESANTDASGFIWLMSGQAAAAAPTAPTVAVAI